jgi:NADH:ubiquinone oxidoreductase subunit E
MARPVQPGDAEKVIRYEHGSRVPGWDRTTDLRKDPMTVPEPATTPVPEDLRAEIERYLGEYPDLRSAVLPALAAVQRRYGWCTPEGIVQVAAVMGLTPAYVQSVATFYDMLDTQPTGRHRVYVCTNISCSLNGAAALHERVVAQTKDDPDFHVRTFECLGACDIAPMASVDGIFIGPIALDEVPELVDDVKAGRPPLPAKQLRSRQSVDPAANSRAWPVVPSEPGLANPANVQPEGGAVAGPLPTHHAEGPPAVIEQAPDPPPTQDTEA